MADESLKAMGADTMQLVTTADARYVVPLAALVKSIGVNLRTCGPAVLHVVDGGLGRFNRRRVERSAAPGRVRIEWTSPPTREATDGLPVFGHVNVTTYFRILAPLLLPELDKVIYLDADTLVIGDIGELWSEPMDAYPLMAVQESDLVMETCGVPGWREMGLPPRTPILNGGVLLMNLRMWKAERIAGRVLEYLRANRDHVKFWDQDGLNAILAGRWKALPRKWNYRVDCGVDTDSGLSGEEMLARIREHAMIVHFASATKPWHYGCDHPARSLFFEYLAGTSYGRWQPAAPSSALMKRHLWGQRLRRLPIAGKLWRAERGN